MELAFGMIGNASHPFLVHLDAQKVQYADQCLVSVLNDVLELNQMNGMALRDPDRVQGFPTIDLEVDVVIPSYKNCASSWLFKKRC